MRKIKKSSNFKSVGFNKIREEVYKSLTLGIKENPEIQIVELYTSFNGRNLGISTEQMSIFGDTHKITYKIINGEKQLDTFKIERLEKPERIRIKI